MLCFYDRPTEKFKGIILEILILIYSTFFLFCSEYFLKYESKCFYIILASKYTWNQSNVNIIFYLNECLHS